ncbi:tetratricopeptide repeat protein [Oecophyllibacter saccharovorans]|uniref:Tetratricopeptide repeat protein n=1 Tax=Oecophyllibacter saccharovorans TaxID=2558360 RepID=A0A506UQW0_9PROT|nr:tetratricopeptide repeat protein [Oecophyllibacter saccharovorans]TPW35714.1 tetratricopeptide repeat protein [Oecophyllibacter saccharovorans]
MADEEIFHGNNEAQSLQQLRAKLRQGLMVGGVVLLAICAGAGGWAWQRHSLHLAQQKASARYCTALQLQNNATNREKAAQEFADLAAHAPDGVRSYAAMRLADYRARTGQLGEANTLWQQVIHDRKADPALQGMARFLVLNMALQHGSLPPAELQKGFEALIKDNSSWSGLAREGLVALDLQPGATQAQQAEAKRLLGEIVHAPDTSAALRERASLVLQILGEAG